MSSFINMLRAAYARAYRFLVDRNIETVDNGAPFSQMPVKEAAIFTASRMAELLMWYGPSLVVASVITVVFPYACITYLLMLRPEIINALVFDIEPGDNAGSFAPVFS